MKKLFLFLAVASTTMFVSCSDDDSTKKTDKDAATSIVLTSNLETIELGQEFTFIVTDNNSKVVTSNSTLFVNNVEIDGTTFTPETVGTFTIKATHKNTNSVVLTSNEITVVVTQPIPAATAIVLTASASTVEIGTEVTFTVTNNNGTVVTPNSTILVNDAAITGVTWTPTTAGTFTIKANHTNSNDVVLTSGTISIIVTAPVTEGYSLNYNGTNVPVTAGDMIYWGAYYTDSSQTEVVEIFALATHNGDLSAAAPTNLAYVDFTLPYNETEQVMPTAGTYNWVDPTTGLKEIQLKVNNTAVTVTPATINNVAVNISELEFATGGALTMTYTTTASFGTSTLSVNGSGSGFLYDASSDSKAKAKTIEVFNSTKFKAKKAKFFASLKK